MRAYGAKAHIDFRYFLARSNRGRRRASAEWWNRYKWMSPRHSEAKTRRALRGSERQRARTEIRHELHLWWLEQKLQTPTRHYNKPSEYAYLKEVATQEEIDRLQYEEYLERKTMDDLLYQEDNWYKSEDDYWDYYDNDYDHELEYTRYREPCKWEPEWRDAWVQGEVHDHRNEDRYEWASPSDYDDLYPSDDYEYDLQEWYREHREATTPCPNLRLDSERNRERLRSGDRFYRKNKRTVRK